MILLQASECQGVECGSLNVDPSHKLIGCDNIRRCGFVGVGMAFLEEVCHCRVGFEVSYMPKPHLVFQTTS